jgi:shikimate kinase
MNIVLTGFMGTGKSTIGNLLAQRLKLKFIDTDAQIETETGSTIAQIFQSKGEGYFRQLESQLAIRLAAEDNQIIATGGGFVLNPHNIKVFKPNGVIVALTASPEAIYERVKEQNQRPLLEVIDPLARITELLIERAPFYLNADLTINTVDKKPTELVEQIITELLRRGFVYGRSQT